LNIYQITVILPVYNSQNFISETLNSLLTQSYSNFKVILINDGSNDSTGSILEKIKDPRVNYINLKKNMGVAFCRNLGVRKSKSKYVCFLDSDDLFKKKKLEDQIFFMEENNLDLSYTSYDLIDINSNFLKKIKVKEINNFEDFIKNTSIATSTLLIKRSLIGTTKFNKKAFGFDDYLFKCHLLKKDPKIALVKKILTSYRIGKKSLSSNVFRNFIWLWKINRKFNKLNFFKNLTCLICVSLNSLYKNKFMKFF